MVKYFKQGDTTPAITDVLLDSTGSVVDLTGSVVYFLARLSGNSEHRINGSATIVTASAGSVSYSFGVNDLALSGTYQYEWEVHTSASAVFTVPTSTYGTMTVYDDVGTGGLTATHGSGTVSVTHSTQDTQNTALGRVPPSASVYAYLGTQPVAKATADSSGGFTLTLVDNLQYSIQAQYPGYTFTSRTVAT